MISNGIWGRWAPIAGSAWLLAGSCGGGKGGGADVPPQGGDGAVDGGRTAAPTAGATSAGGATQGGRRNSVGGAAGALRDSAAGSAGAAAGGGSVPWTPDAAETCPNAPLEEPACRRDEDCAGGEICEYQILALDPCEFTACVDVCELPEDCAEGWLCLGGVCAATCAEEEGGCPDDMVCAPRDVDADLIGCSPLGCDEGWECPEGWVCDGGPDRGCTAIHCSEPSAPACPPNHVCIPGGPDRGCAPGTCRTDDDCDCGWCDEWGQCRETFGTCHS